MWGWEDGPVLRGWTGGRGGGEVSIVGGGGFVCLLINSCLSVWIVCVHVVLYRRHPDWQHFAGQYLPQRERAGLFNAGAHNYSIPGADLCGGEE